MKAEKQKNNLPEIRGRYRFDTPLSAITWFQVGGPAEILFKPADEQDLQFFLKNKPADLPVTVIGVGSNLLVRDGGIEGVVIRLGRLFTDITIANNQIHVGAGALDTNVAQAAAQAGLSGLEFLIGIPGTIGGALRMNAGAYGSEIKDVLISCTALDEQGEKHVLTPDQMGLTYRHCDVPENWIFTSAIFKTTPGDKHDILAKMEKIKTERETSQPVRSRTGGSTFANPPGEKAWELIDRAGLRGSTIGGAQISQKHCNFLINTGTATAQDLEKLGEKAREEVHKKFDIMLSWEIKRIGKK